MTPEIRLEEEGALTAVRRRGLVYLNYIFWTLVLLCFLVVVNTALSLGRAWLGFLEAGRRAMGLRPPAAGPDYWMLAGAGAAAIAAGLLLLVGYRIYRRAWNRRLNNVWRDVRDSRHAKIRPLHIRATEAETAARVAYVRALAASPEWLETALPMEGGTRESYVRAAECVLQRVEQDVARRAVTIGLVIGFNRSRLIDSVGILAAGFEVQFYVLTRLGKKPSLRTWTEMFKRTASSLFLNWYVSGPEALTIKLAIQQTALGIAAASDAAGHALQDIDWDEIAGSIHLPGLSHAGSLAATTVSIGAQGIRHIGEFIAHTSDDLLRGVLAAGVLYYHGMALAAECLALDEQHRATPEMNRTISQAMAMASEPAGRILRDQVRTMRGFLRKRRQMALAAAKGVVKQGADAMVENVRSASSRVWASVKPGSRKGG